MKKTFYQGHIGFCFGMLGYLPFIVLGVLGVVYGIIEAEWLTIILSLIVTAVFSLTAISILYYHVIFYDDKIYISGELFGKERTQYKDEINYNDIEEIKVLYTNKNSKKKSISSISTSSLRPRLFFEFQLNNGRKKWMYISYFSKKQKERMIALINEKTGLIKPYDEIEKQDLSFYNRNKKNKEK